MGWWRSEHGVIGDHPADIMDHALRQIVRVYQEKRGKEPSQGELSDLIEFCTGGSLVSACGRDDEPWSKELYGREDYPRAGRKGGQGILGPHAACGPGEMVNVDPKTGDHFEQGEADSVIEKEIEEAKERGIDPEEGSYGARS